jgi:hypothetical protein
MRGLTTLSNGLYEIIQTSEPKQKMENQPMMKNINIEDIERLWKFQASPSFQSKFNESDFTYMEISHEERDRAILGFIDTLESDLVKVGPHRAPDWEKGWGENLTKFKESKDLGDILPKYFGKIPLIRWQQNWVLPNDSRMEYNMLGLILEYLIEKYLNDQDTVYEFGCGTGHNLLRIRDHYRSMELHGLDWAESSQNLLQTIAVQTNDHLLYGSNFDYFNPNSGLQLSKNAVVLTVASLEQTGTGFKQFIDYLVTQKPRLVIHVEPMWEPLDPTHLLDSLSIKYFRKREYLNGLLKYVEELQSNSHVSIIEVKRTYVGSFFIDGYSILVWTTYNH